MPLFDYLCSSCGHEIIDVLQLKDTATLTLDTTYETGKTLVSGSVDISGQPSGTSMRYKIETLNQSALKVCRIHGASLLWA